MVRGFEKKHAARLPAHQVALVVVAPPPDHPRGNGARLVEAGSIRSHSRRSGKDLRSVGADAPRCPARAASVGPECVLSTRRHLRRWFPMEQACLSLNNRRKLQCTTRALAGGWRKTRKDSGQVT